MKTVFPESELSRSIRYLFRRALLALGKASTAHIYDIDDAFLDSRYQVAPASFVRKIKRFYEGLTQQEKPIFVADTLEWDAFYRFWHLDGYKTGEYSLLKDNIEEKMRKAFQ